MTMPSTVLLQCGHTLLARGLLLSASESLTLIRHVSDGSSSAQHRNIHITIRDNIAGHLLCTRQILHVVGCVTVTQLYVPSRSPEHVAVLLSTVKGLYRYD